MLPLPSGRVAPEREEAMRAPLYWTFLIGAAIAASTRGNGPDLQLRSSRLPPDMGMGRQHAL